jgi:general secretion pathway protein M
MTAFRLWWRDRSVREQWLLGTLALLIGLMLLWFGVLRPLAAARDAAMARHVAAVTDLGEVRAMTARIRAAERRSGPLDAVPLLELVERRAQKAGLTTEAMAGSGDGRVTMRIPAVRPQVVLGWLDKIESGDGIAVERLSIDPNADSTVAVTLTLGRAR